MPGIKTNSGQTHQIELSASQVEEAITQFAKNLLMVKNHWLTVDSSDVELLNEKIEIRVEVPRAKVNFHCNERA